MPNDQQTPDFAPNPKDPCFCGSGKTFSECCGNTAEDRPPPHGVILQSGWLNAAMCDQLVSFLEGQPRNWLTVIDRKSGTERLDPMRVTERVSLGSMRSNVVDIVRRAIIEVMEPEMDCEIERFVDPNILRYSPGGQFRGHADSEVFDRQTGLWRKMIDRDFSMLLYLNDAFEGGNITFLKFNFSYRPTKGDLLVFPSDQRYAHRAEPVKSGSRWSVVSWASIHGQTPVQSPRLDRTVLLR
jgi:hypothetical protein